MKILQFPTGEGQVSRMMRAREWKSTPVGAIEAWPQSLKTVVRLMLDSRYAMWMSWGPQMTFFCNDAYLPTVGVKRDWVLGAPANKVWEEIWPDIGPRIEHVLKTGQATYDEGLLLFLERSGYPEETYHTFSYSPVYDDTGKIGGHLCVVTEETERVIGERRLRSLRELGADLAGCNRLQDMLAAVERVLGANRKDLPFTLTYLFDDDGQARLAGATGIDRDHPAAASVLGAAGKPEFWPYKQLTGGAAAAVVVSEVQKKFPNLPTGDWEIPPRQAVLVALPEHGQDRPAGFLIVGLNPYRAYDTSYSGFIDLLAGQIAAAYANVQAHEQERLRAEALAQIDKAKTAFFSNVSHEFRTPLTLMLGPLEEILKHPDQSVEHERDLVDVAHRNGLRLLKLVNTLLDFSRLEAGRVQAQFRPIDLANFTAGLASSFQSAMEKAGLRYRIDCPPVSQPVYVDADMWEKIVLNLLSNAFKFTLTGGVDIVLRPASDGHSVELHVRDTGVGVPEHELPRLFERFHRVEGAQGRSMEGSGIGLALVQELVKLHGGAIRVSSTQGKGTQFTVTLPFGSAHLPADHLAKLDGGKQAADQLAPTRTRAKAYVEEALRWLPNGQDQAEAGNIGSSSTPEDLGGNTAATGQRILLADDNTDMREYVRRLLRSEGYEVESVGDGEQALAAARLEPPDLVLTDVMMPKLDGFGLLQAIRGDAELRDIPVLLLSARAGEEARIEGLTAGADDYLTKPFSARELLVRVASALQSADMRREIKRELKTLNETLEHRVIERSKQLAKSEQQFSMLVAGVTDYAIFMLDTKGHVASWNAGAERIKGYKSPEIIGRSFSQFYTERDRAAGVPVRALHDAATMGRFEAEGWRVRKDGTRFWASVVIDAIHDDSGTLIGFAKITRDMTEKRNVEEQLRQAQKMEAIGQLTGGVAHDFNNLLIIILGNLETLLRQLDKSEPDPVRLRRVSENALRGAQRAASLTQRLLAFSRRQPLEPKPVNVNRLVSNMSELLRRTLGEQISVETVLAGGLWQTHTDPNQLESAILNLAVNARDAMPEGGKLTIETANTHLDRRYTDRQAEVAPGQYVSLAITDNGAGMSKEVLTRVFEPFFTTKDIGHGTGLGLSQVYGFVKQSGGHVKIYSEPGQGTTVRIYLPRLLAEEEEVSLPCAEPRSLSAGTETILVVEDDDDVRQHSTQILTELGYRVFEAPNGQAALEILERQSEVKLLFTDVGLPGGMNGRQLAEEARRRRPYLKVLFTTGYARNAIVHDGRLDPGVNLITKPFTFNGLAAKARELLEENIGPRLVLVVEDEELVRLVAVDALQALGYRVEEAGSATEAANKVRVAGAHIDAAVIDIGLPDRRGDALAAELRALYANLPIVIASGYAESSLRERFGNDRMVRFLTKPYDTEQLGRTLRDLGLEPGNDHERH